MRKATTRSSRMRSRSLKVSRRTTSPARARRLSDNVSARRRTYSTSILNTSSLKLANIKVIAAVEHAAVVIKKFSEAGI